MPVTLEKIKKDLANFPYEIQMYCYHKMNNRDEEAQTYLDAYLDMQNKIVEELQPKKAQSQAQAQAQDSSSISDIQYIQVPSSTQSQDSSDDYKDIDDFVTDL